MSHQVPSSRLLRAVAASGLVTALSLASAGCTGETPVATTPAAGSPGATATTDNPKKSEAKQAGTTDKGNLMPEFPKGPGPK